MFSTGDQAGFEATIIRPDGTKFNEYDVKHYADEEGRAVTECWLECEDDAIFKIKIQRSEQDMTRFASSLWQATCRVDGRELGGAIWRYPHKSFIARHLFSVSDKNKLLKGKLTFAPIDITPEHDPATIGTANLQTLGSITINLRPGDWTPTGISRRKGVAPIGSMHEDTVKLARVTKSTDERASKDMVPKYKLRPDHPKDWQVFVFKYRHRAALELNGVIEAPIVMPPPQAAKRKRDKHVDALKEKKSPIEPVAGPSRRSAPQTIVIGDSDDEEESETDEASRLEQIRKYKAALERLENAGKGKGKNIINPGEGERSVKVEGSGTSVKVEQEQRNVRAKRDQPMNL